MTLRMGSMCSGYGGLDMAVHEVLGGEVAWVADMDPGACTILAQRLPGVPNLGDITGVDWSSAEPVDVLTAGFPCQDISLAGKRAGMRKGTRSGIWTYVAAAIDALRPSLVILENVRSLTSAAADSDVEPCPWCLGDSGEQSALRALGAVLGDLADLGFDAEWVCVGADDAGAPHRRKRIFIVAWPAADAPAADERRRIIAGIGDWRHAAVRLEAGDQPGHSDSAPAEDADLATRGERRIAAPGKAEGRGPRADAGGRGGAPAADTCGEGLEVGPVEHHGPERPAAERGSGDDAPTDADHCDGKECPARGYEPGGRSSRSDSVPADAPGDGRDEWRPEPARFVRGLDAAVCGDGAAADSASFGHGHPGPEGERRIPPPPVASAPADADSDGLARGPERDSEPLSGQAGHEQRRVDPLRRVLDWGNYTPAIHRWEAVLGRPAPRPTEPGRTGERLSPRFVEWMMGLPEGWVTDVPGLSRNAQLKALGNGVVPQQAEHAIRHMLSAAFALDFVRPVASH